VPAWYLDTFKAGLKQQWPFTSTPLTRDFPLDLPDDLRALTRVHAALQSARLSNGFKRVFLNANLFISKILQRPVCSFYCDDDSLDFACVSDNGVLQRLRCGCGDLEIVYQNGGVTIQPLQPEVDDDEGGLTNFRQLHDPEAGVAVMERNKEQSTLLHFVAGSELAAFSTCQPRRSVWEALTASRKCRSKSHQAMVRPLIHSDPPARTAIGYTGVRNFL
jgi:hypothetical protein